MKKHKKRLILILECILMLVFGIGLIKGNGLLFPAKQEKLQTILGLEVQKEEVCISEEPEHGTVAPDIEGNVSAADNTAQEPAASEEDSLDDEASDEKDTSSEKVKLLDIEDYSDAPEDNGCPYYVKVNRQQNVVTVYALDENGYYTVPVRAMICSVGKNNGTPTGTFTTSDKHEWSALVGGVYGQYAYRINGQIMFHSVPYYTKNKGNLESEEYNKLGTAASLGCVRLSVSDAKWLYDNCPSGTIVTIYDSDYPGPLGKPVAEVLDLEDERSCWDPMDPDKENPWNTGSIRILGGGTRTIERGYSYDLTAGVLVLDEDGNDLTEYLTVESNVNPMVSGTYDITYKVSIPDGQSAELQSSVRVKDSIPPEIVIESDKITLNRIQASSANCMTALYEQLQIIDAGAELSVDHLTVDTIDIQKGISQTDIEIFATDDYGNRTEKQVVTVYFDWDAPVIGDAVAYEVTGSTDEEIRQAILDVIPVEDESSGIADIKVTWTKRISVDSYSVMIIAKDEYGNISTRFFNDFHINIENNE